MNAQSPIDFRLLPSFISFNPEQPRNALSPMDLAFIRPETFSSPVHPEKRPLSLKDSTCQRIKGVTETFIRILIDG